MTVLVKRIGRKNDAAPYVQSYEALRNPRTKEIECTHIAFTADKSKAKHFTEAEARELCDYDFFGKRYVESGYGGVVRTPPYEREPAGLDHPLSTEARS